MNKKFVSILLTAALALTGCATDKTEPINKENLVAIEEVKHEPTNYITAGRYYFNADLQGQVVTSDGNVWEYTQDIISEEPSYHNEPVFVVFNDNGTPSNIYDDSILGLVLDRETAIYDALEAEFSNDDNFTIKREGNVITIGLSK